MTEIFFPWQNHSHLEPYSHFPENICGGPYAIHFRHTFSHLWRISKIKIRQLSNMNFQCFWSMKSCVWNRPHFFANERSHIKNITSNSSPSQYHSHRNANRLKGPLVHELYVKDQQYYVVTVLFQCKKRTFYWNTVNIKKRHKNHFHLL